MRRGTPLPPTVRALRLIGGVALAALVAQSLGFGGQRLEAFFSAWVYNAIIVVGAAAVSVPRRARSAASGVAWACLGARPRGLVGR